MNYLSTTDLFLLSVNVNNLLFLEVEHSHHAVGETSQDGGALGVNLVKRNKIQLVRKCKLTSKSIIISIMGNFEVRFNKYRNFPRIIRTRV